MHHANGTRDINALRWLRKLSPILQKHACTTMYFKTSKKLIEKTFKNLNTFFSQQDFITIDLRTHVINLVLISTGSKNALVRTKL